MFRDKSSDHVELVLAVRFVYIDNYIMFQINQLAELRADISLNIVPSAHKGNVESHASYILDAWMLTTTKAFSNFGK